MKTAFRKSFQRDLKTLKKSHKILARIRQKIQEVEAADDLQEVASVKKLSGGGDYRIGLAVQTDTIVFVRCLHRRDIYRYFP